MAIVFRPLRSCVRLFTSGKSNLIWRRGRWSHGIGESECSSGVQRCSYVAEMRKSAFEGNILRLIRDEIEFEKERCPNKPAGEFILYGVDDKPGEQWIVMKRNLRWGEDIKIEATMFDGVKPSKFPEGFLKNIRPHITVIVDVCKPDNDSVLEFVCSSWPDAIEIEKVYIRTRPGINFHFYTGPLFSDMNNEMKQVMYDFLESRGIDDDLAIFLHRFMLYKDKSELIRWMETVKSFIEKKSKLLK